MSDLTPKVPENDGTNEPPADEMLAGEYVLGVLEAEQRRAVQARIDAEPLFAQRVAEWERRLGPLATSIEPIDVPGYLWPRIRQQLGWTSDERVRGGLWRSLGFWRVLAALAAAAAIAAVVVRVPRFLTPQSHLTAAQPGAEPVTTLAHGNGTPAWLASVDAQRGTVLLVPVPAPPDARGRVPELWLIPPGKSPLPLGLLSTNRSYTVNVPADLRAALTSAGAVLAVSLEPPGGAPHGVPTGPVIATGMIQL